MATKYGRGGFARDAAGGKLYSGPETGSRLNPRRRLLYIYIGILLFTVLLLVFYGLGLQQSLALLPVEEGIGVVVNKSVVDGAYFVTVEVDVLAGDEDDAGTVTLADSVRVPQDSYERVEVGETLHVAYQVSENRRAVYVRELRVVAPATAEPQEEPAG